MIKKEQRTRVILRPMVFYSMVIAPWLLFTAFHQYGAKIRIHLKWQEIGAKMGLILPLLHEMLKTFIQPAWCGAWIFIALFYFYLILKKQVIQNLPVAVLLILAYLSIYLINADPIYYLQSSFGRLIIPIFILCMFDFMQGLKARMAA